jgi:hypothetical protein
MCTGKFTFSEIHFLGSSLLCMENTNNSGVRQKVHLLVRCSSLMRNEKFNFPKISFSKNSLSCLKNQRKRRRSGSSLIVHMKFPCMYWEVHFFGKLLFQKFIVIHEKMEKIGVHE